MRSLSKRWALWGAGISLAASVSGAALYFNPPHGASASERSKVAAPAAVPVTYETVQSRHVATWQQFSGRLEAVDRVDVRPRAAGAVQSIHFR